MPARSVLTVTPWIARSEPTAFSTGCQTCDFTTSVLTAAGPGACFLPSSMPAEIWCFLKKKSPAITPPITMSIRNIRLAINVS